MTKPLILFDIDETLINTTQFVNQYFVDFPKLVNTTAEDIKNTLQNYQNTLKGPTDFNPDDCIRFFAAHYQHDVKEIEKVFYHPDNFGSASFPETEEVLNKLKQMDYVLGIYSEGFTSFQERKLTDNGIEGFFNKDQLYILRRKMDPKIISNLPANTIIIDDKPEVITFLEKFPNIIPLHINRKATNPLGKYTLTSLNDLFSILDSLSNPENSIE